MDRAGRRQRDEAISRVRAPGYNPRANNQTEEIQ
jgi:hypothetical protein